MEQPRSRRIVEGPLSIGLLRFGAPLAAGMALQVAFNLVDAWILGKLPPAEIGAAMGALGICDQIAALGTILCYGVCTATAARLSVLKGAGDTDGVRRVAWQSLLVVFALSVVFGALGLGFGAVLVRDVVGAKGDVASVGSSYLRVILGGSFSIFFLLQLVTIQRALGSSKTPVLLMVLGNAVNVVLAILLVFGPEAPPVFAPFGAVARALGIPGLGMPGAAWATVAARTVVLVPNALLAARRFGIAPRRGELAPDRREMEKLFSLAWPASTQLVLRVLAMVLVTSLVARAYTTPADQTASTAIGLVFRVDTMALFVAMGWGSAAQTFVGQNLGAGRVARARASGLLAALYDAATSLGLAWAALHWGEDVLRLFDPDPAPLSVAMQYLRIVAPSYVGLGVGVVLANAIAGAGATRTALVVDGAVLVGALLPASLVAVGPLGLPVGGLFWCVTLASWAGAVAFSAAYLQGGWVGAVARSAGSS